MGQAGVEGLEDGAVRSGHGLVLPLGVTCDAEEVRAVRLHARSLVRARRAGTAFDDALALTADAVGEVAAALALARAVGAAAAGVTDLRPTAGGEGGDGHEGNCENGAHQSAGTIHHLPRGVLWAGSVLNGEPGDAASARAGWRFRAKVDTHVASELEDILVAFSRLVEEHEASQEEAPEDEDPENFRCEGCVDCVACRFCTACERCSNCTYCDACSDSADCTQSRECVACADCSQSNLSGYCEKSSYLTLCLDCDNCVQCFGCVGLSGAEFHILNEPFKRGAYFKKVAELRKLLDVKLTEGWMPPWVEDAEEREPALEEDLTPLEQPELQAVPAVHPVEQAHSMEVTAPVVAQASPSGEPNTEVSTPAVPRRVDPYTDRTSRLPEVSAPKEHTGSWPPADAKVARSMDRSRRSAEPWEALFEPDELPPPRTPAAEESPMTSTSTEPTEPSSPTEPKRGRFDRLVTPPRSDEPASSPSDPPAPKAKRSEPPASFLGKLPEPAPSEPEPQGGIRRAKRPQRD